MIYVFNPSPLAVAIYVNDMLVADVMAADPKTYAPSSIQIPFGPSYPPTTPHFVHGGNRLRTRYSEVDPLRPVPLNFTFVFELKESIRVEEPLVIFLFPGSLLLMNGAGDELSVVDAVRRP